MPIVRRNEPISKWGDGDFVQGFALLCRKEVRQDRNGREYLDIELCDASGSIGGRVWPDNPVVKGDFREKDFVAFQGTVRLYRDQAQVILDVCRRVKEKDRADGFDEALLIPSTPEDLDDLWRRFAAIYPGELGRPAIA